MNHQNAQKIRPGIWRFLIKLFQVILYIPIQIIFIPFAIIGAIYGIYRENSQSKKLGVSYSAGQALQFRWFMHYFNTRFDPLSVAFTKKFPCESVFALWSVMGALIISQRLFGFTTRLSKVVEPGDANLSATSGSRVMMFDRIMEKYLDEMEQIVLPGAGFDLIALYRTKGKKVTVYELDQVNTMNTKVETLKNAGIEHDWIIYIPVDYSKESWADKLLEAGFDKTKKTLFVWQSVSLYLEADMVRESLMKMAELSAKGSIIVQDFYSRVFARGGYSKIARQQMRMIEKMGEPWKFGIDMSDDPKAAIESFLNGCGLKITEYTQFGEKLDIEPFYCIVEAEKL